MVSNIYQGDNTALSESVDQYQPSSTEGKKKKKEEKLGKIKIEIEEGRG